MCKILVLGLVDKRPIILSLCKWLSKIGEILVLTDNPMYFEQSQKYKYIDDVHFIYSLDGFVAKDMNCYNLNEYDYVIRDYFNDLKDVDNDCIVLVNEAETSDIYTENIIKIVYEYGDVAKEKNIIYVPQDLNHFVLVKEILSKEELIGFKDKYILKATAIIASLMLPNLKSKLIYDDLRKDVN